MNHNFENTNSTIKSDHPPKIDIHIEMQEPSPEFLAELEKIFTNFHFIFRKE